MPHSIDAAFTALPLRATADAALARARALGADHADFRFERVRSATWRLRDARPAGSTDTTDLGYAVRVVHGGAGGSPPVSICRWTRRRGWPGRP